MLGEVRPPSFRGPYSQLEWTSQTASKWICRIWQKAARVQTDWWLPGECLWRRTEWLALGLLLFWIHSLDGYCVIERGRLQRNNVSISNSGVDSDAVENGPEESPVRFMYLINAQFLREVEQIIPRVFVCVWRLHITYSIQFIDSSLQTIQ